MKNVFRRVVNLLLVTTIILSVMCGCGGSKYKDTIKNFASEIQSNVKVSSDGNYTTGLKFSAKDSITISYLPNDGIGIKNTATNSEFYLLNDGTVRYSGNDFSYENGKIYDEDGKEECDEDLKASSLEIIKTECKMVDIVLQELKFTYQMKDFGFEY